MIFSAVFTTLHTVSVHHSTATQPHGDAAGQDAIDVEVAEDHW